MLYEFNHTNSAAEAARKLSSIYEEVLDERKEGDGLRNLD